MFRWFEYVIDAIIINYALNNRLDIFVLFLDRNLVLNSPLERTQ